MSRKILGSWILPLLVLVLVMVLTSDAFGSIGVIQDYMEDEVVKAPRGGTTCHRIWLSTSPTIEHGQARLVLNPSSLPDFVQVDLREDGIYNTTKGSSEAIIFYITPPAGEEIGAEYRVSFLVEGVAPPSGSGMVNLVGKIGSGFVIRVVDSDTVVPDRCGQLPRTVNLPPECGDKECNGDETCKTCPEDCGECPQTELPQIRKQTNAGAGADGSMLVVIAVLIIVAVTVLLSIRFWNMHRHR